MNTRYHRLRYEKDIKLFEGNLVPNGTVAINTRDGERVYYVYKMFPRRNKNPKDIGIAQAKSSKVLSESTLITDKIPPQQEGKSYRTRMYVHMQKNINSGQGVSESKGMKHEGVKRIKFTDAILPSQETLKITDKFIKSMYCYPIG